MAQYKVPQDVEADDKLLGPFSFRQFVYLMVVAGLGGLAFLFFKIFPLLVIIPIPFMIFLLVLALPLKKDQPMETYLSAVVSFYMKPRTRTWEPGQGETTIVITAPKQIEEVRTKGLSEEEATHRLSFLADIVDTEGYAIKGEVPNNSSMNAEFYQEANNTQDMFDAAEQNTNYIQNLNNTAQSRHDQLINQMRNAIDNNHSWQMNNSSISHMHSGPQGQTIKPQITSQNGNSVSATSVTAAPMTAQSFQSQVPNLPQPQSVPMPQQYSYTAPTANAGMGVNPMDAKDGVNSSVIIQPDESAFTINNMPINPYAPTDEADTSNFMSDNSTSEPNESESNTPDISASIENHLNEATIADSAPNPEPVNLDQNPSDFGDDDWGDNSADTATAEPEPELEPEPKPSQQIIDLAHNEDFSIETIAQQAKRIEEKNNNGEVYISLH